VFARNAKRPKSILVPDGILQDSIASIDGNPELNNHHHFPSSIEWFWVWGIDELSCGLFFATIDVSLPDEKQANVR